MSNVFSWLKTMFGEKSLSKASMAIVFIFTPVTHIMLETLCVETDSIPFVRENNLSYHYLYLTFPVLT